MGLQDKEVAISAGGHTDIDEILNGLLAELAPSERGHVGVTAYELALKAGIATTTAQHHLRGKVERGEYEAGYGMRYSKVLKRNYRTVVYWPVRKE